MKRIALTLGLLMGFLVGPMAFGHGESKLGPHKGYIRMPGAFHTEITPAGKDKFKVYLLDINFKNPSMNKSKLEIKVTHQDKESPVKCGSKKDHYFCELPEGFSLKEGKLIVNAVREDLPGADVTYDLPLKAGDMHGGM